MKTNNLGIFSGSVSYVIMCFFKVCSYKNNQFFMVARIFIWFSWCLLELPVKIIVTSQIDYVSNLFYYILGEATVNEIYSKINFECSFLFRFFLTRSSPSFDNCWGYHQRCKELWVENLHLLFGVSIKSTHEFEWCRVTCLNGLEKPWKWPKSLLMLFLKYGRKIPVEKQNFQKLYRLL